LCFLTGRIRAVAAVVAGVPVRLCIEASIVIVFALLVRNYNYHCRGFVKLPQQKAGRYAMAISFGLSVRSFVRPSVAWTVWWRTNTRTTMVLSGGGGLLVASINAPGLLTL